MKITDTIHDRVTIQLKGIPWQDFRLVLLGAVVLLWLAARGEEVTSLHPLRIILGLAYVLFVPGYCLTTAIFPQSDDLDRIERIGLSLGFSIALVSVLAVVLDRLHWGLYLWPILLSEFGMTGLFMAVALWRRSQLPVEEVNTGGIAWQPRLWWVSLPLSERRLYKMLLVILPFITVLALWALLPPTPGKFTTEFYILGPDGFVADYPYQVSSRDEVTVTIGVVNREKSELNYHFEVWVTNSISPNRRERVMQSESFLMKPGEKYEQAVPWHMPWVGDNQKVEILLFYNNDPEPSRHLRMFINVQEKP